MSKKHTIITFVLLLLVSFSIYAYNYAEVMQKAIYFYECQQSGPLPGWNRVEWRGPSGLKDGVVGGWYDAGDNVKFGLPMAEAASMLGWALYEYKTGFVKAGQLTAMENNLKFVLDYFVNCHKGSSLVYQIGAGSTDHAWWGPAELVEEVMTRPTYTCNASCVTGQTAAALAIGSIVFNNATYLTHAKQLFDIADTVRSDATYTEANSFYTSYSGFWDELMWAATWLYIATKDASYLTKAESYIPNLGKEGYSATDPIKYKWGQSWDDVHYGAMLLLARLTNKPEYINFIEMHLDWWTIGYNGEKITYTPGGLAWLTEWGCLRHAANTGFLAFVYGDWVTDAAKKSRYQTFAKRQIDYALGDNPRNSSYVVGFGANSPKHPHHRTAHSSYCGMINIPDYHRHTIYGALVGGPGNADNYTDAIDNYTNNEVACDYNAGFVACLAKLADLNGGTPLANFPPPETKEKEMFVQACYNSGYGMYTEVRMQMNNRSGWPARSSSTLSARYFVDLSEVFAAGLTISDCYVKSSSSLAKVSPLTQYKGNIYYTTIDFTGTKISPVSMNDYFKEVQFQVGISKGDTSMWNTANDYSYKGMTSSFATMDNIPVYDNNVLVNGAEPDGPSPTPTPTRTPTATPTPSVLLGDVNKDGRVNINDALLIAQYSAGMIPVVFDLSAADVNRSGTVDVVDALIVARYSAGLITQF